MTNLTERLDQHIQSIREANNEISPKELLDLMKSRKSDIKKLHQSGKDLYITHSGEYSMIADAINDNEPSYGMFSNSYVGGDEYNFIAYCICSYLGVDSGIDINKAYRDIEKLLKNSEREYKRHLDPKEEATLQWYIDNDQEDSSIEYAKNYCKKYGISPKEMTIDADDGGDEYRNPVDFIADASDFAKMCKANQLANKLKSLSDKGKWLLDRIYLL